jgi:biotin carboxyl carrier protein
MGESSVLWEEIVQPGATVVSPAAGTIETLNCARGGMVSAGQQLIMLRGEASL